MILDCENAETEKSAIKNERCKVLFIAMIISQNITEKLNYCFNRYETNPLILKR
jgi:hypothetical protein